MLTTTTRPESLVRGRDFSYVHSMSSPHLELPSPPAKRLRTSYSPQTFQGKVAIVTHASSDIGRKTAIKLGQGGSSVVLVDSVDSRDVLIQIAQQIEAPTHCVTADISKPEDVQRYVNETLEKFGTIDYFFNNTKLNNKFDNDDHDDKLSSISLQCLVQGIKYVGAAMKKKQSRGSIVNYVISPRGLRETEDVVNFSAARFAVVGLTMGSAKDLAADGIRVNAISTGVSPTIDARFSIVLKSQYNVPQLMGGFGSSPAETCLKTKDEVDEIAKMVVFLFSDDANNITGGNVPVCPTYEPSRCVLNLYNSDSTPTDKPMNDNNDDASVKPPRASPDGFLFNNKRRPPKENHFTI